MRTTRARDRAARHGERSRGEVQIVVQIVVVVVFRRTRVDYAVDEQYDPDFDPLGLGPRWEVPWGAPTLIATLVAVEASFYVAGAPAPAVVYSGARSPDEIPFDDQEAFAKDLAALFDEPGAFADIVITAEVIQTVMALGVVAAVASAVAAAARVVPVFNHGRRRVDVRRSEGQSEEKRSEKR